MLFVAQLVSNVAAMMQTVGSAWQMGDLGGSASLVALIPTAALLPVLFFGIPGGALADIIDRRRYLVATQTWITVFAACSAILTVADLMTPALLLVFTFTLGIGIALSSPAWQAIQPDLVPKPEMSSALALGSLSMNVGRSIGPAMGGLLVAAAGVGFVYLLNAVSSVAVTAALVWWRRPDADSRLPAETLAGAVRAGLRYGANSPLLRAVLTRLGLFLLPGAALLALLPTVVRGRLSLGPAAYGLLLACFGIGATLTAVTRARLSRRFTPDSTLTIATLMLAAGMLVQAFVTAPVIVGMALFAAGCAWTLGLTTLMIAAQSALPWWVRARGLALFMIVAAGSIAIGSALWGAVASWSLERAHLGAVVALVVGLIGARRWKLAATVGLDLSPATTTDLDVTLNPRPTDGPVLVTVAYQVPDARMEAFVEAMRGVERHRRRTGASRWGLFRDLAAPERFVETFLVQSWSEHRRQHERVTVAADADLDRVRGFIHHGVAVAHYLSAYSEGALQNVDVPGEDPSSLVSGLPAVSSPP